MMDDTLFSWLAANAQSLCQLTWNTLYLFILLFRARCACATGQILLLDCSKWLRFDLLGGPGQLWVGAQCDKKFRIQAQSSPPGESFVQWTSSRRAPQEDTALRIWVGWHLLKMNSLNKSETHIFSCCGSNLKNPLPCNSKRLVNRCTLGCPAKHRTAIDDTKVRDILQFRLPLDGKYDLPIRFYAPKKTVFANNSRQASAIFMPLKQLQHTFEQSRSRNTGYTR